MLISFWVKNRRSFLNALRWKGILFSKSPSNSIFNCLCYHTPHSFPQSFSWFQSTLPRGERLQHWLIFSFIISQSFVNYTNFFPTLQDYHTINFIFNPNTTCFSVRIPQEISVYQVFALNIFCVYFHYIFLFLQNPPYYLLYVRQTIPCGKFFSLSMYIPLEYSSCFASNNIEWSNPL